MRENRKAEKKILVLPSAITPKIATFLLGSKKVERILGGKNLE